MNPSKKGPAAVQPGTVSVDELRGLATRFQKLLESERTRLAQELHDNLTQKLTVISLELSLMDGSVSSENDLPRAKLKEKIKELAAIVSDMIHSLREIKAQLRPKVLDEFGLVAAVEWETKAFGKKTGIEAFFRAEKEELTLAEPMATELFRMFREIMANIADHAQARKVTVELKEKGGRLVLRVSDDGIGITPAQTASPKSLGLLELRERATALSGTIEITGASGAGTTVTVAIPLQSARAAAASGAQLL